MLTSLLVKTVDISRRFAQAIVTAALLASVMLAIYVAGHIKINTDINQLLSERLPWRQREIQLEAAFPQKTDNLVIVIDAQDPEKAEAAAAVLADKLSHMPDKFTSVSRPDSLPFLRRNGLLYLPTEQLAAILDQIAQAQPMLGAVTVDPSLRGFFGIIGMMAQGVAAGAVPAAQVEPMIGAISDTVKSTLNGQNAPIDIQSLMPSANSALAAHMTRKYIVTKPVLHYENLQPGEIATKAVRDIIAQSGMTAANGVQVRLTGPVPLNDEEFASVSQGAGFATALSGLLVFSLLFLAMRTWRIVLPIALTLVVGLIASTAFATAAVGSLNLISVAFAVMFIGIAVDFGIQFGIRYRDQHFVEPDHAKALARTAKVIALPLAMAAGSTALGFLSFIPTNYRGVSELGLIAGVGMLIAFALNITLLPALMTLISPPAEREALGFKALTPLNAYLQNNRQKLLVVVVLLTIGGLAIASRVRFDFDPLNLKNSHTESVQTMFDIMRDPDSDAYAAQLLLPSRQAAEAAATRLEKLPETDHTMTLESYIPQDQNKKLAMIADTAQLLAPVLAQPSPPAPTDDEILQTLRHTSAALHKIGDKAPAAQILADRLDQVTVHDNPQLLQRLKANIVDPLHMKAEEMIGSLHVSSVGLNDIPTELQRDWVTPDGKWLLEIFPKRGADGNPRDPKTLTRFIKALEKAAPDVTGAPVSIRESGRTIIDSFIHAGIYALISIAVLALLILRNLHDVIIMMVPLLIAMILTLATITLLGVPLNFANIIALPLLLSLGISYAIYFVFYWRSGHADLLQSSMARAILFSAATVLVAFLSLCLSSHPGTRGMGELLTIALIYSLLCTYLILPVLLGRPETGKSIN